VEAVGGSATDAGYSEGRWSCRKVGDVSARVMDGGVVGEGGEGRRSGGWRDEQLQVDGGIQQQWAATGV
jgi:hypothetical protein